MPLKRATSLTPKPGTKAFNWCRPCNFNLGVLTVCPACKSAAETRMLPPCKACEGSGWSSKKRPCRPCDGKGVRRIVNQPGV